MKTPNPKTSERARQRAALAARRRWHMAEYEREEARLNAMKTQSEPVRIPYAVITQSEPVRNPSGFSIWWALYAVLVALGIVLVILK